MTQFDPKIVKLVEDNYRNTDEAFELIDLINAEFQSDPKGFDARIVERVKLCAARREHFIKEYKPIQRKPNAEG